MNFVLSIQQHFEILVGNTLSGACISPFCSWSRFQGKFELWHIKTFPVSVCHIFFNNTLIFSHAYYNLHIAIFQEAWTGHWSVLNSVVLAVHCYFNVWLRIKRGWRSFLLRQVWLANINGMIVAVVLYAVR